MPGNLASIPGLHSSLVTGMNPWNEVSVLVMLLLSGKIVNT